MRSGRLAILRRPGLSRPIDVLLVALSVLAHLLVSIRIAIVPPVGNLETGVLVLPLIADAVAIALLLLRDDRTGLSVACLLQWLLVLYLIPAGFLGLVYVPAALLLSLAAFRPRPEV